MSDVTIVGASARAAAMSARRAGLTPWAADLFADTDLRALVPDAVRCPVGRYPRALLEILANAPPVPWMYTGGLENHPNLVQQMSEVRPLWGNGLAALAACRSPFHVERLLRDEGLPVPEVRAADAERPDYCSWLRKPISGSAGHGIEFASTVSGVARQSVAQYYQQFVPGIPMSAVFVRTPGDVRLLGVTEQLIGESWLNAPPFRYAGNIGPVEPSPELVNDLLRIGLALGEQCGLLGLFGVDFVLHDGRPWVVEVNPRYPASVEILELATGVRALALHRLAFDPDAPADNRIRSRFGVAGKAIIYAPRRFVMPAFDAMWGVTKSPGDGTRAVGNECGIQVADVPAAGEVIEAGWPILTVLAEADSRDGCAADLRRQAEHIQRLIGHEPRPPALDRDRYARLDGANDT